MQRRHLVSWSMAAFVLASSAAALADDLKVPRQYRTLEDALAVAQPGDRVLVRGGTYDNVQVKTSGIEIVARRATVNGYLWIDAANVTVSGLRLGRFGRVVITGDDVTVTGTKASGRGRRSISVQGGRRAHLVANKLAQGDIEVLKGVDASVTDNRVKDGEIRSLDFGAVIESNTVSSIVASSGGSVLDNRCQNLEAYGDSCDVANNVVSDNVSVEGSGAVIQANDVDGWMNVRGDDVSISGNSLVTGGINVSGERASILGNTVDESPLGVGVRGDDFTISGNDLTSVAILMHDGPIAGFSTCPAIAVIGTTSGGTITDNVVTHVTGTGITVDSPGVTISGNDVQGIGSSTSIVVNGDANTISYNSVSQTGIGQGTGDGIDVSGDGNTVTGNDIGVVAQDAILVVSGTGNVIDANAIDAAPGCGLVVTCHATDTVVSDCTVNTCGLGVVNAGVSTSLTNSTTQDNEFADILDISNGFETFEGNTYTTLSTDRLLTPANLIQNFD